MERASSPQTRPSCLNEEARRGKFSLLLSHLRRPLVREIQQELEREAVTCTVLVGDIGVGKRSLVHLLTLDLIQANCPSPLRGKPIMLAEPESLLPTEDKERFLQSKLLSLGLGVGDHSFPIVFVPNFHLLLDRTKQVGEICDWILSPGNKWIMTITPREYERKLAAHSKWTHRAFKRIDVPELSTEETRDIIIHRQSSLRMQYQVSLEPGSIDAAISLASEHLSGQRRPKVVLDLLEESCRQVAKLESGINRVTKRDVALIVSQWTGIHIPVEEEKRIEAKAPDVESVVGISETVPRIDTPRLKPVPNAKSAVVSQQEDTNEFLPDELIEALYNFVANVGSQVGQTGGNTRETWSRLSSVGNLQSMSPAQLREQLEKLKECLTNRLNAQGERKSSEQEIWRDVTRFLRGLNQMALDSLNQYAKEIMENPSRLPNQKSFNAIFPFEFPAQGSPQEIRQYLTGLDRWVNDIVTALTLSVAEVFMEMIQELRPRPGQTMDRLRPQLDAWMDQGFLLDKWRRQVSEHLSQRLMLAARRRILNDY